MFSYFSNFYHLQLPSSRILRTNHSTHTSSPSPRYLSLSSTLVASVHLHHLAPCLHLPSSSRPSISINSLPALIFHSRRVRPSPSPRSLPPSSTLVASVHLHHLAPCLYLPLSSRPSISITSLPASIFHPRRVRPSPSPRSLPLSSTLVTSVHLHHLATCLHLPLSSRPSISTTSLPAFIFHLVTSVHLHHLATCLYLPLSSRPSISITSLPASIFHFRHVRPSPPPRYLPLSSISSRPSISTTSLPAFIFHSRRVRPSPSPRYLPLSSTLVASVHLHHLVPCLHLPLSSRPSISITSLPAFIFHSRRVRPSPSPRYLPLSSTLVASVHLHHLAPCLYLPLSSRPSISIISLPAFIFHSGRVRPSPSPRSLPLFFHSGRVRPSPSPRYLPLSSTLVACVHLHHLAPCLHLPLSARASISITSLPAFIFHYRRVRPSSSPRYLPLSSTLVTSVHLHHLATCLYLPPSSRPSISITSLPAYIFHSRHVRPSPSSRSLPLSSTLATSVHLHHLATCLYLPLSTGPSISITSLPAFIFHLVTSVHLHHLATCFYLPLSSRPSISITSLPAFIFHSITSVHLHHLATCLYLPSRHVRPSPSPRYLLLSSTLSRPSISITSLPAFIFHLVTSVHLHHLATCLYLPLYHVRPSPSPRYLPLSSISSRPSISITSLPASIFHSRHVRPSPSPRYLPLSSTLSRPSISITSLPAFIFHLVTSVHLHHLATCFYLPLYHVRPSPSPRYLPLPSISSRPSISITSLPASIFHSITSVHLHHLATCLYLPSRHVRPSPSPRALSLSSISSRPSISITSLPASIFHSITSVHLHHLATCLYIPSRHVRPSPSPRYLPLSSTLSRPSISITSLPASIFHLVTSVHLHHLATCLYLPSRHVRPSLSPRYLPLSSTLSRPSISITSLPASIFHLVTSVHLHHLATCLYLPLYHVRPSPSPRYLPLSSISSRPSISITSLPASIFHSITSVHLHHLATCLYLPLYHVRPSPSPRYLPLSSTLSRPSISITSLPASIFHLVTSVHLHHLATCLYLPLYHVRPSPSPRYLPLSSTLSRPSISTTSLPASIFHLVTSVHLHHLATCLYLPLYHVRPSQSPRYLPLSSTLSRPSISITSLPAFIFHLVTSVHLHHLATCLYLPSRHVRPSSSPRYLALSSISSRPSFSITSLPAFIFHLVTSVHLHHLAPCLYLPFRHVRLSGSSSVDHWVVTTALRRVFGVNYL